MKLPIVDLRNLSLSPRDLSWKQTSKESKTVWIHIMYVDIECKKDFQYAIQFYYNLLVSTKGGRRNSCQQQKPMGIRKETYSG